MKWRSDWMGLEMQSVDDDETHGDVKQVARAKSSEVIILYSLSPSNPKRVHVGIRIIVCSESGHYGTRAQADRSQP